MLDDWIPEIRKPPAISFTPVGTPPASQSEALVESFAQEVADRTTWGKKTDTYARIYQAAMAGAKLALGHSRAREASAREAGRREGIEEAVKVAESAMFNEYGRPQPVLVARLRALAEKQP